MVYYVLNGEERTATSVEAAKKQIKSFLERYIADIADRDMDFEGYVIGIHSKESEAAVSLAVLHLEDMLALYRGDKWCVEFLDRAGSIRGIGNSPETVVVDNNGVDCVAKENGYFGSVEGSDVRNAVVNLLSSWNKQFPNKPVKAIFFGENTGVGVVPVYVRKSIFKCVSKNGKLCREYDLLVGCNPEDTHSWLADVEEFKDILFVD